MKILKGINIYEKHKRNLNGIKRLELTDLHERCTELKKEMHIFKEKKWIAVEDLELMTFCHSCTLIHDGHVDNCGIDDCDGHIEYFYRCHKR